MGADLLLNWVTWDKSRKLNWAAGHKAVDALETDENGEITTEGGDITKESLHEDLKSLEEACAGKYRDASGITVGRLNVLMTGGMSWGDSPGDTYETLSHLFEIDTVLEAVGFNLEVDTLDYRAILEKILRNKAVLPLLIGVDENLDKMVEKKLRRKAR